jgi:hypothetical protein
MVNTGSRFWFGVVALGVIGALAYLLASGGEPYGTLVLAFTAVAGLILGVTSITLRDGDVALAADGAPSTAAERRPVATRFAAAWPATAALGAAVCAVGLATGGALLYVGFAILGITLVEWMVQSWAERSTADATVNQRLRNRIMYPVEIPALSLIGIAVAVLAFSRILLALPKAGSTVVAIVVASVILGVGVLLSSRPRVSSSLLAVLVVLGAVGLLGGGIVAAVAGEREFEEHHAEEGHAEEGPEEGSGSGPGAEAPEGTGHADEAPAPAQGQGGG